MAGGRLIWPLIEPVLSATGAVVSGATLTVYANRTTTPVTIYADSALTTPIANPQTGIYGSNSAGRFFAQTKVIWLPSGALYTFRVDRPDGSFDVIDDISPQGGEGDVADASVAVTTIYGLTLSNSQTNPTTHISTSVGQCRDSTDSVNMRLVTATTKRLDQAWSAGQNGGARLSGTLGPNQTWHWFLMEKADGTTDVGADSTPTAPALPTGYIYYRRLGAVLTDGSNVVREFVQTGDWFKLKTRSTDYAAQANGGGPFLRAITVPTGIKVEAEMYFQSAGTASTTAYLSGIYDPDFGTPPAFGASTQWAQIRRLGIKDSTSTNISYDTVIARQFTDTNRNVYTYSSDSGDLIALGVLGWRDTRAPI
jgi:hypothetical protein